MSLVLPLGGLVAVLAVGCGGERPEPDSQGPVDSAQDSADEAGPPATGVGASLHDELGSVVLVSWEQLRTSHAHVDFRLGDEAWTSTPERSVELGQAQQAVLGVPYDEQVSYRLVCGDGGHTWTSDEGTIRTGARPAGIPVPELLLSQVELQEPTARYFLTSINEEGAYFDGPWWTTIFDREGRLVWARQTPAGYATLQVRPSWDGGGILVDHNSFWVQFDDGDASTIHRYTLDGTEQRTYAVPGLQHAYTEIAGGLVLWGANTPYETLEEVSPQGERRTIWSCEAFHQSIGSERPCSSNTLFWRESTDSLLFSFFNTVTVVEIDRSSGETLRWFGDSPGAWDFDPPDSAFFWQHGVGYTDSGSLLLSTTDRIGGAETLLREYRLNSASSVLEQIWTFGEGEGLYSESHSDARRLPNGNTLHNLGRNPRLREVTPDGTVVWDMSWGESHVLGLASPLDDLYALLP